jgi:DNA helicase HerA-like ATPase
METHGKLDQLLSSVERIGVIGSPSTTGELSLDVLGAAVGRKLVGELALFRFVQDSAPHYALGQITEVKLRNIWHEDATMRSLIRQRGRVDAVSERQDTHQGEMTVSAVFAVGSKGYEPSILGTVPSTGTNIHLVNDEVLDELLSPYKAQLFYLGRVYGSKPRLPLWFKHFAPGPDGAGEAYHIGVFGKTGSGKSVLAKMILTAYARYPQMALLVIDPQGEFAKDIRGKPSGEFQLPLGGILRAFGKKPAVLSVRNLVLDTWALFEQILFESLFFERLSIPRGENRLLACEILGDKLQKASVRLRDLHLRASFDKAWELLKDERVQKTFYRTEASRARFQSMLEEADAGEFFRDYWAPVTELFREDREKARSVEKALGWLFSTEHTNRPVLVIDLSKEQAQGMFWNDKIQALVIKRLLQGVTQAAEQAYGENKGLNTLVVMDEAHRLAPREIAPEEEEAKAVRATLIDAVRTTRKYGLGWMFISQTLSSLHPEILQQLRISFFGFGLALGTEYQSLSQLVGGKSPALELYRLFRDPHSSFDIASRQYSFMTIGPVSPLSFAGTPLFLNVFNSVETFMQQNQLMVVNQP